MHQDFFRILVLFLKRVGKMLPIPVSNASFSKLPAHDRSLELAFNVIQHGNVSAPCHFTNIDVDTMCLGVKEAQHRVHPD